MPLDLNMDILSAHSGEDKERAITEARSYLTRGAKLLNIALCADEVEIICDVAGKTAGWAHYQLCTPAPTPRTTADIDITQLDILTGTISPLVPRNPRATQLKIRFNYQLLLANSAEFFARTVPHEVAHILSACAYGKSGAGHGKHWRHICHLLGMSDVTRCHSYDTSQTPRARSRKTQRRWTYTCSCATPHNLSTTLHNKIQRGVQTRQCTTCRTTLRWEGDDINIKL